MSQNKITVTSDSSWLTKVETDETGGTLVIMPNELYKQLKWAPGTIIRWTFTGSGFNVEVVEGAKLA